MPNRQELNLILPPSWKRSFARRVGDTGFIVTAALSFRSWTFGVEIIRGFATGAAVVVGPLWLGFAWADFR
jgi:hypothetical protein